MLFSSGDFGPPGNFGNLFSDPRPSALISRMVFDLPDLGDDVRSRRCRRSEGHPPFPSQGLKDLAISSQCDARATHPPSAGRSFPLCSSVSSVVDRLPFNSGDFGSPGNCGNHFSDPRPSTLISGMVFDLPISGADVRLRRCRR